MVERSRLSVTIPEELRRGAYSNMVSLWHGPHEFTLDFLVTDQEAKGVDGDRVVPGEVVARVKLPIPVIFMLAKAIADEVTEYEAKYGRITRVVEDKGSHRLSAGNEGDDDGRRKH